MDNVLDKLITAQTQCVMLWEQKIAAMKLHLQVLEEAAVENSIFDEIHDIYAETIAYEEKQLGPQYRVLEQYMSIRDRFDREAQAEDEGEQ